MNQKHSLLIIVVTVLFLTITYTSLIAYGECSQVVENINWTSFYNEVWNNAVKLGKVNVLGSTITIYYVNMSTKYFYELYTGPQCHVSLYSIGEPSTNTWQALVNSTLKQGSSIAYVLGGIQLSPYEYIPYTKILFNTTPPPLIMNLLFIESLRGFAVPLPVFMELLGNTTNTILVIDMGLTKTVDQITERLLDDERIRLIIYRIHKLTGYQVLKYTYRYVHENKSIVTLESNEVVVQENNKTPSILVAGIKLSYETMQPLIMGHILLVSPKINITNSSIEYFIRKLMLEYNITLEQGLILVQLTEPIPIRNRTSLKLIVTEKEYTRIVHEFIKLYNNYTPLLLHEAPKITFKNVNEYIVVGLNDIVDVTQSIVDLIKKENTITYTIGTSTSNSNESSRNMSVKAELSTTTRLNWIELTIAFLAIISVLLVIILVKTRLR